MFNKNKKIVYICALFAFLFWSIPFCSVLYIDSCSSQLNIPGIQKQDRKNEVVEKIFNAYAAENRGIAFRLIFVNNLKVLIVNMIGGVFLGIGTLINLIQNGFYAASIFSTIHHNGMGWKEIIYHTAPHSFEMIGIWLSGGLGFYIALNIYNTIRKSLFPTHKFYKTISVGFLMSVLIILFAAYIEAFISVK